MCQSPYGYRKRACKSKISNFDCVIFINQNILRFEISMNNSSRMTEIQGRYDLIQIFLKNNLLLLWSTKEWGWTYSDPDTSWNRSPKTRKPDTVSSPGGDKWHPWDWKIRKNYSTMLGCLSSLRMLISRIAVLGIPSSSFSSRICFSATVSFVSVSFALKTTP